MIRVKAPITGWHEVTEEQAWRFAVSRYRMMMCSDRLEKLRTMIDGLDLTEASIHAAEARFGS